MMHSPWINDFDDLGLILMRRILPKVVSRVSQDLLLDLHWKKLVISFSFKYVLVNIKRGNGFGDPRLVAVGVDIIMDGCSWPTHTLIFPTSGEFLHPLGNTRWVQLYLFPGILADLVASFCSISLVVKYLPRRPF